MTDREKLLELIEQLRGYDHAFISADGVRHFTKPFGFEGRSYRQYANPTTPKGLTLKDDAESAVGLGAHELAQQICNHLGIKYMEMFGRGSQLRVCCDAIEAHLKTTEKTDEPGPNL